MTFWLLTSEFPPMHGGGISTYCLETARMLVSNDYQVTIITQDPTVEKLTEHKENGYIVVKFNPTHYFTSSFLGYEAHLSYCFAEAVKALIIKKGIPDIIESQEYMGIAYYLLNFKWLQYPYFKDLKIVLTLHAPSFLYLEYNKVPVFKFPYFWIGEMEKFCIQAADLVISPSNYLVKELKDRGVLNEITVHVVKNPYQVDWEPLKIKTAKDKVVFFGKLIPQKGCLQVIDYFKKLWETGFNYPLVMIGGGDHLYHPEGMDMIDYIRQKYSREIKEAKLNLLGSIKPEMISEQLSDAYLIVIPSIVDNLPYTVLEAMSRGKMVFASVQGGQAEAIQNNVNGFLFDHLIHNSFENQLKYIFSLPEESVKLVSENAHQEIKKTYAYQTVFRQKHTLLQELLKKKSANNLFPFIRSFSVGITANTIPETESTPLLSVVIPYYNMGQYIDEAISSVKNSNYKNIEIIIVNDGSTETESIRVLDAFKNDQRIKIINKKNEGLALARNTGAVHAAGHYLAFLDPDDKIENTYYEKAMNVLLKLNNIHFVGCWAKYFGDSKGYWPAFNPEPPCLLYQNMINSSALVLKKESFLKAGLNDAGMIYGMEDYESVINMVKNGYQGVVLPEPLWDYRIRKNSMARAFTKSKKIYLYHLIAEKHSSFYAQYATEIVHLLNANGPGYQYDNPSLTYNNLLSELVDRILPPLFITKVKQNPLLRKMAIRLKRILK